MLSDFVRSPHDGSLISGATLCHYCLATGPNVGQIQLIQEKIDHLRVRVKKSDAENDELDQNHITRTMDRLLSSNMRDSFDIWESIEHEQSDKYRFCISKLDAADRQVEMLERGV